MNILVCLKMVSQSTFTDLTGNSEEGFNRLSSGNLCMNPADLYSLELALRMKDRFNDVCITVLTMGPLQADAILREALAMGADHAIHVCDDAYAGSDTLATSAILSEAIQKIPEQDLILCGRKAIDSETGHIGPQIAALLNLSCISGVSIFHRIEENSTGDPDGYKIWALQYTESGMQERILSSPAVLTVINGTVMIRKPTILGLRKAKNKEITVFDRTIVPAAESGTETIRVIEMPFSFRNGEKETDLRKGIERLAEELSL